MSRYIGNYIRATSTEPTQSSTQGIWSLSDQLAYRQRDQWPPERDPYYNLTTLHLPGNVVGSGTQATTLPVAFNSDSSTNKFLVTPVGDVRASSFSPYGTGYSTYFSSTSGLTISGLTSIGSGDVTIETLVYMTTLSGEQHMVQQGTSTTNILLSYDGVNSKLRFLVRNDSGSNNLDIYSPTAPPVNRWFHFAATVQGTTGRIWIDGQVVATGTVSGTRSGSQTFVYMGDNGSGGSRPFNGYLSNTRIVVGTAVYTANFIPPTTNLTSVAGTSLLTNQSNRFINLVGNVAATISQGNPSISQNSPFVMGDTASGSGYFDGTGDYLNGPTNTAAVFNLTGDFTIECWAYFTSASTAGQGLVTWADSGGWNGWQFINDAGTIKFEFLAASSAAATVTGGTVVNNQWYHLAVVRNGSGSNNVVIYINGSSSGSPTTYTGTQGTSASSFFRIGVDRTATNEVVGYLSGARVVNGTALYTSSFSIPTAPPTLVAGTSLLTLQTRHQAQNSGFLDSSPNNFVVTRSGNATQGSFSPFLPTGWSTYVVNGTSTQLRVSDNAALRIGTSQFNIEAWVYPTSYSEPFYILRKRAYNNVGVGTLAFTVANGAVTLEQVQGPATIAATSAGKVPLNTWTHVAVSRDSLNNVRIFINGVVEATASSTYNFNDSSNPISLLCDYDGRNASSIGYCSNLRFVIGSAIYTSAFTPSTSPLTTTTQGVSSSDVKLLLFQSNRFVDNSSNNFSITTSGTPSVQAFSPFAPTSTYLPQTHGGSAYFDGSDYLDISISNSSVFDIVGAFSLECWFYYTSASPGNSAIIGKGGGSPGWGATSGNQWALLTDAGVLYWMVNNGSGGNWSISTTTPASFTWHHIAISYNGTTTRVWLNGSSIGTNTSSYGLPTTRNMLRVGVLALTSPTYYHTGYISGLHFVQGRDVYNVNNTSIAITTTPPTVNTNTQFLLNFTNAGIVDATGRNVLETVGNAHVSPSVSKFGSGSMYFDGTLDSLQSSAALSELAFLHNGTPWTAEGWFYTGSTSAQTILSTNGSSGSVGMNIAINSAATGDITCEIYRGVSGSILRARSSGAAWSTNTWVYFAAVLDASKNLTVYINGSQVVTTSGTSFSFSSSNPAYQLAIGRYQFSTPGEYFNGYINDIRITRGVARTITASLTKPFPIG